MVGGTSYASPHRVRTYNRTRIARPMVRLLVAFRRLGPATALLRTCGHDCAGDEANGEKRDVHEGGGLANARTDERRQREIDGVSVVHTHHDQEQHYQDEEKRFQQQPRVHSLMVPPAFDKAVRRTIGVANPERQRDPLPI